MLKYLGVAIVLVTGFYVRQYNETHTGSYMLIPLLEWAGDYEAQAELSWQVLAASGGALLVLFFVVDSLRWFRARKEAERTNASGVTETLEMAAQEMGRRARAE